jgi:16S rRNA (cytidine1402-2'-O)-methyltransferase
MGGGTLYIVSGPIGNLKDITHRALEILKEVDIVLSEDTRETDKLLKHYQLEKHQISYRDQNHKQIFPRIVEMLDQGQSVALVTDSGTPLISDPGFKLVRELKEQGFAVVSIPGPSAAISALSVSGLPTDKFTFLGFLPKNNNSRREIIEKHGKLDTTLIIYESPYRVIKLLFEIQEILGNRSVCLAKDLTKMYENVTTGKVEDLLKNKEEIKEKGEYVVLVSKEG